MAFPHLIEDLHTNVLWAGWTVSIYNQVDLEKLRDDVKVFTDFLETQIQVLVQKAAEAAAAKAKKRGPV